MIIVTSEQIEGKKIVKTFGLVKGSSIRARHVGRDFVASLRTIVGGEIPEYTQLMAQARDESVQRMVKQAEDMGANAIVATRFVTSMVMQNASEILAYGTAVAVE
ncbi:MAG: YbjQ family protein [Chloroflexota bacterium]|nr:YbjQ family protein [Chloroflexota bacterium]